MPKGRAHYLCALVNYTEGRARCPHRAADCTGRTECPLVFLFDVQGSMFKVRCFLSSEIGNHHCGILPRFCKPCRRQNYLQRPHPPPRRSQLLQMPQRRQEESRPRPYQLSGRSQRQWLRRSARFRQPRWLQTLESHHTRRRTEHAAQPSQTGRQRSRPVQKMDSRRSPRNRHRQSCRGNRSHCRSHSESRRCRQT